MSLPPVSRVQLGAVGIDLVRSRAVDDSGPSVEFSTRELELLRYLVERPGRVVSRDALYEEVWGYSARVVSRAVDTTVSRLRATLEAAGAVGHLHTVRGQGYTYFPPGAASLPPPLKETSEFSLHLERGARLITLLVAPGPSSASALLGCLSCIPTASELRWVHVGSVASGESLRGAIAGVYGGSSPGEPGDEGSTLRRLVDVPDEHWLFLSDAGQLLDDTAQVAMTWLGAIPGLRLVLTSDDPLEIAGEHLVRPQGRTTRP